MTKENKNLYENFTKEEILREIDLYIEHILKDCVEIKTLLYLYNKK